MPRKHRLSPVADLARHQQLLAEKALADAQRAAGARRDTLTQLRQFREDYDDPARLGEVGNRSMAAMRDYQHFVERLEQAIEEQQSALINAEQVIAQLREALADATTRAESLALAITRSQALAAAKREASEQKFLDDLAMLAASRR